MKKSLLLILAFLSVAPPLFFHTQEAKAGKVKAHCWIHKKKYKADHWIKLKLNRNEDWAVVSSRGGYSDINYDAAYDRFKGARNGLRGKGEVKCDPSWWETIP